MLRLSVLFSGIFLAAIAGAAQADIQSDQGRLSPEEQYVVEQVDAGLPADLSLGPQRTLPAQFVVDLLTGRVPGVTPTRNGVQILNAIIDEQVDLGNAEIPWGVNMEKCEFNQGVSFMRTNFGRSVSFDGSTFRAPRDATGTYRFGAYFYGMKVGQDASFKNAVFEGPANFKEAEIGVDFIMTDARFESQTETVWLGMKCGGRGLFSGATFAGPVSLFNSSFTDLIIGGTNGSTGKAPAIANLDLSRGVIGRELRIQKVDIADLTAPWLQVKGPGWIINVIVSGSADLSDSDFDKLSLFNVRWPEDPDAFQIRGMNYQYLCANPNPDPDSKTDESESHDRLLAMIGHAAYAADAYIKLEAFCSREGYGDDADNVFITGQRRERQEHRGDTLGWLSSLFIDLLVGYGRHPSQAAFPCAFFVALGCFLFSADKMELRNDRAAKRGYNPFWYSLGLFLPFVDLQADKVWKPKQEHVFLRNYMRVHILLGWILVPLVLAALTGLIK